MFFVLFCFVFMTNFPFGLVHLLLLLFLRSGFGGYSIDFLLSEQVRAVHTKQLIYRIVLGPIGKIIIYK